MTNSIKDTIISTISKTVPIKDNIINYNRGICIDISNNRIGFDTFNPSYSIDLCTSNATINFKDEIRLKSNDSFLVSPIKAINSSTDISCNMLMSMPSDKDFSSIEAAPIIYKLNALYPSKQNIDLGTPDFCWNQIYCKKLTGDIKLDHIDCSTITCNGDISCSNNIYSYRYNIYDYNTNNKIINNFPTHSTNIDFSDNINYKSQINALYQDITLTEGYRGSIAFIIGANRGVCTLFGSDNVTNSQPPFNQYDFNSKNTAMIINGTTGIAGKNYDKYVGIGTINPSEKLEVSGNILASGTIKANELIINSGNISCNEISCNNISCTNDINANYLDMKVKTFIVTILTINNILTIKNCSNANIHSIKLEKGLAVAKNIDVKTNLYIFKSIVVGSTIKVGSSNKVNFLGDVIIKKELSVYGTCNINTLNTTSIITQSIGSVNNVLDMKCRLKLSGIKWAINLDDSARIGDVNWDTSFFFLFAGGGMNALGGGAAAGQPTVAATAPQEFPNVGFKGSNYLTNNLWAIYENETLPPVVEPHAQVTGQYSRDDTKFNWGEHSNNYFTFLVINTTEKDNYLNNVFKFASKSDKKLKTNIQPMKRMLDIIKKLNPVYFTWIDSSSGDYGFIAQELEELIPGIITYKKDDGEITRVYSIDAPIHFISILTKAIQDLTEDKDTEIGELKVENIELKDENIIFKSEIIILENKVTILEEKNHTIKAQLANILERLSAIEN